MSEKDFDLICIGRSCVDLYSGEFGVPLERAMTFTKSVGGSPMNIAIGTSRLGLRVGAITGVGQEDNGRYLKWQLSCEGVDVSAVKTDPKRLTAMVLLSIRGDQRLPAHPVPGKLRRHGPDRRGHRSGLSGPGWAVLVTGHAPLARGRAVRDHEGA